HKNARLTPRSRAVDKALDAGARHADDAGDGEWRQPQRQQKIFPQDFAGRPHGSLKANTPISRLALSDLDVDLGRHVRAIALRVSLAAGRGSLSKLHLRLQPQTCFSQRRRSRVSSPGRPKRALNPQRFRPLCETVAEARRDENSVTPQAPLKQL